MGTIPRSERSVSDMDVFHAFDLNQPGLQKVQQALSSGNISLAKKELVQYFQQRSNVKYLFDYRSLPLTPIDPDRHPYFFQASLGFGGSVKDFSLFAGQKLMQNIYVRPGRDRIEVDLGKNYENIPRFSYLYDQGKRHRTVHDIFVRGQSFEYLAILYHETGDKKVLDKFEEYLQMFFEQYSIEVENTDADANHFVFSQDRDVMSVGWLVCSYIFLLYTRLPYEISSDLAFEIIRHLWFLGIQFRRFDNDTYRPYNHHMWERGLVPYILGIVFPEIPDFAAMKARGREVLCRHIKEDYNEYGGYNEHSIPYWAGASLGEMISRGLYLSKVNQEPLLDEEAASRISATFHLLAQISPPGPHYPSVGDNGSTLVIPILTMGVDCCDSPLCRKILAVRAGSSEVRAASLDELDYCNDWTGFAAGKSSLASDANYMLMSVKKSCGNSGHNHMDMLSLFLSFGGQEFVGEPYARLLYQNVSMGSPERGYLYNMAAHNTVLAYGRPVQPDDMYAMWYGVYRPDSPVSAFQSCQDGMYVRAYHEAYTNCRHTREVLFHRRRGTWVRDHIERATRLPSPHVQRWHLFPDVSWKQLDDRSLLLTKQGVQVLALWGEKPQLNIHPDEVFFPKFVPDRALLPTVIEASFSVDPQDGPEKRSVFQDTLFLVLPAASVPTTEDIQRIREFLANSPDLSDTEKSLQLFPCLN